MFQRGEGCKPTVQSYHDLIRPSPTDPGRSPIRPISVRPSIWEWQLSGRLTALPNLLFSFQSRPKPFSLGRSFYSSLGFLPSRPRLFLTYL